MNQQDFMKPQTHVLGVNLRCKCNGCKRRIKKQLQNIDGVYGTSIDAEQGKVSVTGNVDPDVLIKKLERSGKHAQIWSSEKGLTVFKTKNADQFDVVSSQLKNLQVSNSSNNDNKAAKVPKKNVEEEGEGGGKQVAIQQVLKEMKASKVEQEDGDFDALSDDDDDVVDVKKVVRKKGGGRGGGGMMSMMMEKAMRGKKGGREGEVKAKVKSKGGGGGAKGGGGGDLPVVQGHVATPVVPMVSVNGGGGGVGPMMPVGNPYQQQQYMGMVNQQGMMMNGGGCGAYWRPQPWEGYAPPMPPPGGYNDHVTNMFSDENPEGCSIM